MIPQKNNWNNWNWNASLIYKLSKKQKNNDIRHNKNYCASYAEPRKGTKYIKIIP